MGSPQPVEQRRARRKRLGAWYTPHELVGHLVDVVLDDSLFAAPLVRPGASARVLDPACGDGRFLAAVDAHPSWSARPRPTLHGVDIDADAVDAARTVLAGRDASVRRGDALAEDWTDEPFDLVVGNPPFLNQLARSTTRGGRSRWGGGPYADAAAEFLALAVQAARPDGGRIAFVLPQSLLTSRDAAAVRNLIARTGAIRHAWWSRQHMFDADVRTVGLVIELGARQGVVQRTHGSGFARRVAVYPDPSWAVLVLDDADAPTAEPEPAPNAPHGVLGDLVAFGADFRDQYYGLVGAVGDDVDGPPLVTSGLIEPGRCLWGHRPVRFAKRTYAAPRVDLRALSPSMQRWAATRLVPKVLVANQTRRIEAVLDPQGAWLPSVPVIHAVSDPSLEPAEQVGRLAIAAEVLALEQTHDWVRRRAAGSGLSADALRLSPRLLAGVPLPERYALSALPGGGR